MGNARRITARYVAYYNAVQLHSAIGYVTPMDRLEGRHEAIFEERDSKLAAAREQRAAKRRVARQEELARAGAPTTTASSL